MSIVKGQTQMRLATGVVGHAMDALLRLASQNFQHNAGTYIIPGFRMCTPQVRQIVPSVETHGMAALTTLEDSTSGDGRAALTAPEDSTGGGNGLVSTTSAPALALPWSPPTTEATSGSQSVALDTPTRGTDGIDDMADRVWNQFDRPKKRPAASADGGIMETPSARTEDFLKYPGTGDSQPKHYKESTIYTSSSKNTWRVRQRSEKVDTAFSWKKQSPEDTWKRVVAHLKDVSS